MFDFVNYGLALAKSICQLLNNSDRGILPSSSVETEPCAAAAVDLQQP